LTQHSFKAILDILLTGGDKSGVGQEAFYSRFIERADRLFAAHVAGISAARKKGKGR
jgi:hypothetical protein